MAGVGHMQRICKDAFSVAGAVQETCSSELLGGPGADFLRGFAFWSIRSSGLLRYFAWQVQHFIWPGITFSWQAQYFRQVEWKNSKTHWYEAVSSALNFPLKEASQNCFIFDVVNLEILMLSTSNYNCATPHFIQQLWVRWPLEPLQPLQKTHNFNHLSVHQWIRSAIRDSQQPTSPICFLFLNLPPSPCAVLLVNKVFSIAMLITWGGKLNKKLRLFVTYFWWNWRVVLLGLQR